jgi:hypothetical protein
MGCKRLEGSALGAEFREANERNLGMYYKTMVEGMGEGDEPTPSIRQMVRSNERLQEVYDDLREQSVENGEARRIVEKLRGAALEEGWDFAKQRSEANRLRDRRGAPAQPPPKEVVPVPQAKPSGVRQKRKHYLID